MSVSARLHRVAQLKQDYQPVVSRSSEIGVRLVMKMSFIPDEISTVGTNNQIWLDCLDRQSSEKQLWLLPAGTGKARCLLHVALDAFLTEGPVPHVLLR